MASAGAIRRLQTFVWVFVYGGILVLGIGLMAAREDAAVGGTLITTGGAAIVVGLVLVWIRSRLHVTDSSNPPPSSKANR